MPSKLELNKEVQRLNTILVKAAARMSTLKERVKTLKTRLGLLQAITMAAHGRWHQRLWWSVLYLIGRRSPRSIRKITHGTE